MAQKDWKQGCFLRNRKVLQILKKKLSLLYIWHKNYDIQNN